MRTIDRKGADLSFGRSCVIMRTVGRKGANLSVGVE